MSIEGYPSGSGSVNSEPGANSSEPLTLLSPVNLGDLRNALEVLEERANEAEAAALRALAVYEEMKSAQAALVADFAVEELLKPLRELPEQVRLQRLAVANHQNTFDQAVELLKVDEANIEVAVGTELAPSGKPAYSNAELRAAEVKKRKQTDSSYQAHRAALDSDKQTLVEAQVMLDMLLQQFETARLAAQLTAAQLAAIQR